MSSSMFIHSFIHSSSSSSSKSIMPMDDYRRHHHHQQFNENSVRRFYGQNIVIVGPRGVGKSSIVRGLITDQPNSSYFTGISATSSTSPILENENAIEMLPPPPPAPTKISKSVNLRVTHKQCPFPIDIELLEISGDEAANHSMAPILCKQAAMIIAVFDASNIAQTFESMLEWIRVCRRYAAPARPDCSLIAVIANKIDLLEQIPAATNNDDDDTAHYRLIDKIRADYCKRKGCIFIRESWMDQFDSCGVFEICAYQPETIAPLRSTLSSLIKKRYDLHQTMMIGYVDRTLNQISAKIIAKRIRRDAKRAQKLVHNHYFDEKEEEEENDSDTCDDDEDEEEFEEEEEEEVEEKGGEKFDKEKAEKGVIKEVQNAKHCDNNNDNNNQIISMPKNVEEQQTKSRLQLPSFTILKSNVEPNRSESADDADDESEQIRAHVRALRISKLLKRNFAMKYIDENDDDDYYRNSNYDFDNDILDEDDEEDDDEDENDDQLRRRPTASQSFGTFRTRALNLIYGANGLREKIEQKFSAIKALIIETRRNK